VRVKHSTTKRDGPLVTYPNKHRMAFVEAYFEHREGGR
jgi:hypothetical protein